MRDLLVDELAYVYGAGGDWGKKHKCFKHGRKGSKSKSKSKSDSRGHGHHKCRRKHHGTDTKDKKPY
jgi:hypothetical protein